MQLKGTAAMSVSSATFAFWLLVVATASLAITKVVVLENGFPSPAQASLHALLQQGHSHFGPPSLSSSSSSVAASASSSNSSPARSSLTSEQAGGSWLQHPAVFTLSDLGIWSTSFYGHSNSQPALVEQWWRLRCNSIGEHPGSDGSIPGTHEPYPLKMDLRGVGSAYSPVDATPNDLYQLLPRYVTSSTAALKITDQTTGISGLVTISGMKPGSTNSWHLEAHNLSASATYTISNAGNVSKHTNSVDASRCSVAPAVFRPGSIWTVVTEAQPYKISLYAKLVAEHTSYHRALGVSGSVLVLSRPTAAALIRQAAMQPGLAAGAYVIIVWDGDLAPDMPYYYQHLWYNLVLLATWGTCNVRLLMVDLDEFYLVPGHRSFSQAIAPGGCLESYQHARIKRHNAYFGITAADGRRCKQQNELIQRLCKQHSAPTASQQVRKLSAVQAAMHSISTASKPRRTAACDTLHKSVISCTGGSNANELARLGWQRFFTQQQHYVDFYHTGGRYWAHKSFVDPNYVAAYAIHNGNVVLNDGLDAEVPEECAFGLHLVNLFRYRGIGRGVRLSLPGAKMPFNLTNYILQRVNATSVKGMGSHN